MHTALLLCLNPMDEHKTRIDYLLLEFNVIQDYDGKRLQRRRADHQFNVSEEQMNYFIEA